MEESVLAQWADRAGMDLVTSGGEIVHGWGDPETTIEVRSDETGFSVVRRDHGSRATLGTFGTQEDADAFLLLQIGRSWLADRGIRPAAGQEPAAGTTLDQVDGNYRLTDAAGRAAVFSSRREALWYSRVAGRPASEIEAFLESLARA